METTQEWLSENVERCFPFRDTESGQAQQVPFGLIADLRLFLTGSRQTDVYLQSLSYAAASDTYALVFCDMGDNSILLSGSIARTNEGASRVFLKQSISSGLRVALFTPGPLWDTPAWNGSGDWTQVWTPLESALEPSLVNPGPQSFRRIFIDGETIPPESEWPRGIVETLVGGYGIEFGRSAGRIPSAQPSSILDLNCGPGLGSGYAPVPAQLGYLATFNGQGPDERGNVTLEGVDVLRVTQPQAGGAPIPSTLQILSDGQPCCACDQYQNVSRAVGRRSAKIKDLCAELKSLMDQSSAVFNSAAAELNSSINSGSMVRFLAATRSGFNFSVQNTLKVPAYVYVAFNGTPSLYADLTAAPSTSLGRVPLGTPTNTQPNVRTLVLGRNSSLSVSAVYDTINNSRVTLPPLPFSSAENPAAPLPTANFSPEDSQILMAVGALMTSSSFAPIPPGGVVSFIINLSGMPGLWDSLIDPAHVTAGWTALFSVFKFRSVAVFGASHCFASASETKNLQIGSEVGGTTYTSLEVG